MTRFRALIALLLVALVFSVTSLRLWAVTPNPGHPWSQVGDGIFAVTGQSALRTFSFPDVDSNILTSGSVVTLAQGGTNVALSSGAGVVYSTGSAFAILANAYSIYTNASRALMSGASAAPAWSMTYPAVAGSAGKILRTFLPEPDLIGIVELTTSTATYPDTGGSAGQILRSTGTGFDVSTATYPETAGTSGSILTSDGTNWVGASAGGPVFSGSSGSLTADAYCHPFIPGACGTSATDRTVGAEVTTGVKLKNLKVYQVTAAASASSCVYTIQTASTCTGTFSNTSLSCSVGAGATSCNDTADTVTLSFGQCFRIFFDETGTCTGVNTWSFEQVN